MTGKEREGSEWPDYTMFFYRGGREKYVKEEQAVAVIYALKAKLVIAERALERIATWPNQHTVHPAAAAKQALEEIKNG